MNITQREQYQKPVDDEIWTNEQKNVMIKIIGKTMGEVSLNMKYDSVPQMQEKYCKNARDTRKTRKNTKKKKRKRKKK